MKKFALRLFLALVLCVLFAIPVLTLWEPDAEMSLYENRTLAVMPDYSLEGMMRGEYFPQWESYLADHVVKRDWWLKAYTLMETRLLGRKVVNDVVLEEQVLLPYLTPVEDANYTASSDAMAESILALQQRVQGYGGALVYVGVPEQYSFFRDRYPSYLFNNDANLTRLHRTFFDDLAQRNILAIDMLNVFKADKNNEEYYYLTDHHYTARGAVRTWQEICRTLRRQGIQLPEEEWEYQTLPNPFYGSRGRKLYDTAAVEDRLVIAQPKEPVDFERWDNGQRVESTVVTLPEGEGESVAYTAYMGGDMAETIIRTHRPQLPKALIVGDSFTNALESVAYLSFDEMRSLDLRHYSEKSLSAYLDEYRPDVVIVLRDDTCFLSTDGNGNLS